jgi:hypothetical protein
MKPLPRSFQLISLDFTSKGALVRIKTNWSFYQNKIGKIVEVKKDTYFVEFDEPNRSIWFTRNEFEVI